MGLSVTGLSGNIRTHIFLSRRAFRVIALRPASICLDVIQVGSSAWIAYLPKQIRLLIRLNWAIVCFKLRQIYPLFFQRSKIWKFENRVVTDTVDQWMSYNVELRTKRNGLNPNLLINRVSRFLWRKILYLYVYIGGLHFVLI